jgi:acyl-CoA synthetase (NDP forming)
MALAAAVRYGRWLARPAGTRFVVPPAVEHAVRARVDACHARAPQGGWLAFDDIAALLALVGVPLVAHRTTGPTAADALAAAHEIGFPVVLKATAPNLVHKSDVGGVALALADADAVTAAAERMRASIAELDGFVVQRQIGRGLEALVGVTFDPSLGPLLVAGLGGVAVEVDRDVAFRVTPVTDVDAEELLGQLRGRVLFDGFRGAPPADRAALADVLCRVSALVELVPELLELDLNPVIVLARGEGVACVDARMLLAARAPVTSR